MNQYDLNNSNVKLNCIKKVCNYFFRKIMIYIDIYDEYIEFCLL